MTCLLTYITLDLHFTMFPSVRTKAPKADMSISEGLEALIQGQGFKISAISSFVLYIFSFMQNTR
jgi:hypothetical protein